MHSVILVYNSLLLLLLSFLNSFLGFIIYCTLLGIDPVLGGPWRGSAVEVENLKDQKTWVVEVVLFEAALPLVPVKRKKCGLVP